LHYTLFIDFTKGNIMARRVARIEDPAFASKLREHLVTGKLSPPEACKAYRALEGISQEKLALQAGVNLKVVKAIESGEGNPGYVSLQKISEIMGLTVTFGPPKAGTAEPTSS
jgi:DNA-binding XRE family transcriptional regulator